MYLCNSSVPAESGIGFDWESISASLFFFSRSTVSEMVVSDDVDKLAIKDSIAAIAGVIEGSVDISCS